MSAVQDEAEDGPDFSSDEYTQVKKSLEINGQGESGEDETRTSKENGAQEVDRVTKEKDTPRQSIGEYQNVESEKSSLLEGPRSEQGRPSSADESLSIPDDTPSIQVSECSAKGIVITNVCRALSYRRLLEEVPGCLAMGIVQLLRCDLSTVDSTPVPPPHPLAHRERHHQRCSMSTPETRQLPSQFMISRKMRSQKLLGRSSDGRSSGG